MLNSNYRRLLLAYTLSSIGDWLYRLAIPLLIYQHTHSALSMSVAYALTFLPYLMIMPFGGVIADRLCRRQLLIFGDLSACIFTFLLGALFHFSFIQTSMGYILIDCFVFMIAAITSLYHPAFQSFLPDNVTKDQLPRANSLIASSDNIILFLGPLIGGGFIALLGPINAIFLNALSFLISAWLIRTIPKISTIAPHTFTLSSIMQDLKRGFACVWQNEILKLGCLIFLSANFGIQLFYANFMYYLVDIIGLKSADVGITIACSGMGAIIGSLLAPKIIKHYAHGKIIVRCLFLGGITTLLLLFTTHAWQIAYIWGIVSCMNSIVIVTYFTLRQQVVPSSLLGRVIGITRLISYTAVPIAALLSGWILQQTHNMQIIIFLSGIILTVTGIISFMSPLNKSE